MTFNDLLIDPHSKKSLSIDWENKKINNLDNKDFIHTVDTSLVKILPRNYSAREINSPLHEQRQTHFNYASHYIIDAEVYDYFQEYECSITRDENRRLHEKIISHIPSERYTVLDVGCGSAWLSTEIVSDTTQVISMDISDKNPMKALQLNPHPNHYGLIADVFHLPIAQNSIDCIVASEIIEHVPDPALFIKQLIPALKKGGKLIITTPYNEKREFHLCVHCNQPTPKNAHLHSFNEKSITKLVPLSIEQWKIKTFTNKYMLKLRMYYLLSFLPFRIWNQFDKLINQIFKSPTRLLVEIIK